jgi:hypothetical protein
MMQVFNYVSLVNLVLCCLYLLADFLLMQTGATGCLYSDGASQYNCAIVIRPKEYLKCCRHNDDKHCLLYC